LWWVETEILTCSFLQQLINLMRTTILTALVILLAGCGQFRNLTQSDDCPHEFAGDCYTKPEKNLRHSKPSIEGSWGMVFLQAKSLQRDLARPKALSRGCVQAAELYHAVSKAIEETESGTYEASGCRIVVADNYEETLGEATLYRIDAWVAVPIMEAGRKWLDHGNTPPH
jgi:hypothetical protein